MFRHQRPVSQSSANLADPYDCKGTTSAVGVLLYLKERGLSNLPCNLKIFSRTSSFGRELASRGYQVTSVHLNKNFKTYIYCDILKWDEAKLPVGYFDLITSSSPAPSI